jgi:hypothetical protein
VIFILWSRVFVDHRMVRYCTPHQSEPLNVNPFSHSYFSGFSKKDVAWLHVSSQTLIVADLIFNLPANEQVCLVWHVLAAAVERYYLTFI